MATETKIKSSIKSHWNPFETTPWSRKSVKSMHRSVELKQMTQLSCGMFSCSFPQSYERVMPPRKQMKGPTVHSSAGLNHSLDKMVVMTSTITWTPGKDDFGWLVFASLPLSARTSVLTIHMHRHVDLIDWCWITLVALVQLVPICLLETFPIQQALH